jgi:hypothetical protein
MASPYRWSWWSPSSVLFAAMFWPLASCLGQRGWAIRGKERTAAGDLAPEE